MCGGALRDSKFPTSNIAVPRHVGKEPAGLGMGPVAGPIKGGKNGVRVTLLNNKRG